MPFTKKGNGYTPSQSVKMENEPVHWDISDEIKRIDFFFIFVFLLGCSVPPPRLGLEKLEKG